MPAFMATVTYTAIVFGDDEDEARKTAPDVVRALSTYPVHVEIEPLEQESPAAAVTATTNQPGAT